MPENTSKMSVEAFIAAQQKRLEDLEKQQKSVRTFRALEERNLQRITEAIFRDARFDDQKACKIIATCIRDTLRDILPYNPYNWEKVSSVVLEHEDLWANLIYLHVRPFFLYAPIDTPTGFTQRLINTGHYMLTGEPYMKPGIDTEALEAFCKSKSDPFEVKTFLITHASALAKGLSPILLHTATYGPTLFNQKHFQDLTYALLTSDVVDNEFSVDIAAMLIRLHQKKHSFLKEKKFEAAIRKRFLTKSSLMQDTLKTHLADLPSDVSATILADIFPFMSPGALCDIARESSTNRAEQKIGQLKTELLQLMDAKEVTLTSVNAPAPQQQYQRELS